MVRQEAMVSGVDLRGKTAVVTGASLGIGRATALALGRAGANVVVNYRSHDEQAEEVVQSICQAGSPAIRVQADVADQAAVERMTAMAAERFGSVDIAVSNAAYAARNAEPFFMDTPPNAGRARNPNFSPRSHEGHEEGASH